MIPLDPEDVCVQQVPQARNKCSEQFPNQPAVIQETPCWCANLVNRRASLENPMAEKAGFHFHMELGKKYQQRIIPENCP